jgi:hypothetical protein
MRKSPSQMAVLMPAKTQMDGSSGMFMPRKYSPFLGNILERTTSQAQSCITMKSKYRNQSVGE